MSEKRIDKMPEPASTISIPTQETIEETEEGFPLNGAGAPATSYSMFEPRMKRAYRVLYKEIYFTPERRVLDPKVQELISIAASMVAKCEGCLDGHIKKALKLGVTKEEISDAMSIAVAVNGAAMIDESDRAAARLGLNLFPWNQAIKR